MPVPYPQAGSGIMGPFPLGGFFGRKKRSAGANESQNQFKLVFTEYACVQECMGEHRDWRLCQDKVKIFRECMMKNAKLSSSTRGAPDATS